MKVLSPQSSEFFQKRNFSTRIWSPHLMHVNNLLLHCSICHLLFSDFLWILIRFNKLNTKHMRWNFVRFAVFSGEFFIVTASRVKKIVHRYQQEVVKLKISPLKTENFTKNYRKKYNDFIRWFPNDILTTIYDEYVDRPKMRERKKKRFEYIVHPPFKWVGTFIM